MSAYMEFLYERNLKPISKYVGQNGGTMEQAEEVLHEGIIRVFENLMDGKFRGRSALSSYLYTICRNLWINKQKKAVRMVPLTDAMEESGGGVGGGVGVGLGGGGVGRGATGGAWISGGGFAPDPAAFMEQEELRAGVLELLEELGEVCRKLLIWTDGEGRPMKEAAERLGFNSVQVAMNRKTKCRKELRRLVRVNARWRSLVDEVLGYG